MTKGRACRTRANESHASRKVKVVLVKLTVCPLPHHPNGVYVLNPRVIDLLARGRAYSTIPISHNCSLAHGYNLFCLHDTLRGFCLSPRQLYVALTPRVALWKNLPDVIPIVGQSDSGSPVLDYISYSERNPGVAKNGGLTGL